MPDMRQRLSTWSVYAVLFLHAADLASKFAEGVAGAQADGCGMNYVAEWEAEHAFREMRGLEPLEPVRKWFDRFLADKPRAVVLDIGCGAGTNALWLADQGCIVHAFDSSKSAVRRLSQELSSKRWVNALVRDLADPFPFEHWFFDLVFEIRAFENVDAATAEHAYREIGRVLKPSGAFMCLTASPDRGQHLTTVGKMRPTTEPELREWLAAAGLKIESIGREYPGRLDDWMVVARKL